MPQYYTAIIHDGTDTKQFKKYNIAKSDRAIKNFVVFAKKKFPSADCMNLYNKTTREFVKQVKLLEDQKKEI